MSKPIETRSLRQSNPPHLFVGIVDGIYALVDQHSDHLLIWDDVWAALTDLDKMQQRLNTLLETVIPPECE